VLVEERIGCGAEVLSVRSSWLASLDLDKGLFCALASILPRTSVVRKRSALRRFST
jgi:hypothetical protein